MVLEDVDVIGIEQTPDDDLADFGRAQARRRDAQHGVGDNAGPRADGTHQRPRRNHPAMAAIDNDQPPRIQPLGPNAARPGADVSSAFRRIDRRVHHQPRVIDNAIGIGERGTERPLQRNADRMMGEIDRCRSRQATAGCKPVVKVQR